MMNIRFFKVICAAVLSIGLLGQANAGLILGGIYEDGAGLKWEYIGEFNLGDGPDWNGNDADGTNAPAKNGLEWAAVLFASLEQLAVAAFAEGELDGLLSTGTEVVNHKAWYDTYWSGPDRPEIYRESESLTANIGGNSNLYDFKGDRSAFVRDSAEVSYINYVFKAVEVPEPSTLAIFSLALLGFGVRKLKR
jgi:hypothetical protein